MGDALLLKNNLKIWNPKLLLVIKEEITKEKVKEYNIEVSQKEFSRLRSQLPEELNLKLTKDVEEDVLAISSRELGGEDEGEDHGKHEEGQVRIAM